MDDVDVIVLGGGPAGYAAALRAADLGLQVTLVEADRLGGTCLHHGCVPTRATLHAASLVDAAGKPSQRWGVHTEVTGIDLAALLATRDDLVARNERGVAGHLQHAGVEVVDGWGRLADARTVVVGDRRVTARRGVVLATGSVPRPVDGLDVDGVRIMTSGQALVLDHVPTSMLIVGGGAIGAEFSQIWRAFGSAVTVVETGPRMAPAEDAALGDALGRALRRRGIHVHTAAEVADATVHDDRVDVTVRGHDGSTTPVSVEVVVLAAGRDPNTHRLGFTEAGVRLDGGFVTLADPDGLETHTPGVHAVGDLLALPSVARANVAFAEGMLAAERLAGRTTTAIDHTAVTRITHGLVESAAVGLTEEQARERAGEVDAQVLQLGNLAKGLMLGEPGMIKVIAARGGPVLGITMVGPHASELIGEAALVYGFEATPADVAAIVHPTLSEGLAEVHLALAGRPLHLR
jgi:dihydrolipoamide dehydrogenase